MPKRVLKDTVKLEGKSASTFELAETRCMDDHQVSLKEVNSARPVTKWNTGRGNRLARLISYSNHKKHYRQCCVEGSKIEDCKLGLFQGVFFAGRLQGTISMSRGTLCVLGSQTLVPLSWMCKKHTAISQQRRITHVWKAYKHYNCGIVHKKQFHIRLLGEHSAPKLQMSLYCSFLLFICYLMWLTTSRPTPQRAHSQSG